MLYQDNIYTVQWFIQTGWSLFSAVTFHFRLLRHLWTYHSRPERWLQLTFLQCIPVCVPEEKMLPNIALHTQPPLWLAHKQLQNHASYIR